MKFVIYISMFFSFFNLMLVHEYPAFSPYTIQLENNIIPHQRIKKDPDLAASLVARADSLERKARFDSAIVYLKSAADIFASLNMLDNQAQCYNLISRCYRFQRKNYDLAMYFADKALDICLDHLGEGHPETANGLHQKGSVLLSVERYDEALTYLERALKLRKSLNGENHQTVAGTLNNIALCYKGKREYQKAVEYLERGVGINIHIGEQNSINTLKIFINLINIYGEIGEYDLALLYIEKSSDLIEILSPLKLGVLANYYRSRGVIYFKMANYEMALSMHESALKIQQNAYGFNDPTLTETYYELGNTYLYKNDYIQADRYYDKAALLCGQTAPHNQELLSYIHFCKGLVQYYQQNYDEALQSCEMSLSIYSKRSRKKDQNVATIYVGLGDIYEKKGQFKKALSYQKKALSIQKAVFEENHNIIALTLSNISGIYSAMGKYDKALGYLDIALSKRITALGDKNPYVAKTYNQIGDVFARMGENDRALKNFQMAMEANCPDFRPEDLYDNPTGDNCLQKSVLLSSLVAKAGALSKRYLYASNDAEDMFHSYSTYVLAIDLLDDMRNGLCVEDSKLLLAERASDIYANAIHTCLLLKRITGNNNYKDEAFRFAEKNKARILLDAVLESKAKQFAGIPDSLLAKEKQLRVDLAFCETQLQNHRQKHVDLDGGKIQQYENKVFSLRTRYIELLKKFETDYPKYYQLKYHTSTAEPEEIQKVLDEKTVFIEYVVADTILYSFVISNSDFEIITSPLDSDFFTTVDRYYRTIQRRTLIKTPIWRQFWRDSQDLYDNLIRPIEPWIDSHEKLVIIPDPLVANIPFETLVNSEKTSSPDSIYLIYDFAISYHYSATLFVDSRSDRTPQNGFAGFAPVFDPERNNGCLFEKKSELFDASDPAFTTRSSETRYLRFVPLYESEREISMILDLFNRHNLPSRGYIHEAASEKNLKKIDEQQYLHIATHGFYNRENPSYSGLALSQPPDTTFVEDGILYAREIFNLDLNCDLVVLSSCESGAGRIVRGEGIMALTRGFLYAGVPNVVFSLWKVNDKYTSLLMIDFYRHILEGKDYNEALRQAKLKLLENDTSDLPNYWGAFLLIGQL